MVGMLSVVDGLEQMIFKQKWTFAKTYAKTAPHEYFIKQDNPELFRILKQLIAEEGVDAEFTLFGHTNTYRYFHYHGYKYWGYEIVMNRALED